MDGSRGQAARLHAAARRVVHVHPGPVGELLARELHAYADFGRRLGSDEVLERLAADVLAIDADEMADESADAGGGGGGTGPDAAPGPAPGARPRLGVVRPSTP